MSATAIGIAAAGRVDDVDDDILVAEVARAAAELETASAADILRWGRDNIPRFAVTSSFGADSAILLSIVADVDPDLPVMFLDTGLHFAESLAYRHELSRHLGLRNVIDVRPEDSVTAQADRYGPALHTRDPDTCCMLRKVAPLDEAMRAYDGWATGVRRSQTPDRADTPVVSTEVKGGRRIVKVAPIATWTAADVLAHRSKRDLPEHPLASRGFGSIGCAPCTRPVAEGEDPRAGRWAGRDKTECGIHLSPTGTSR